MVKVAVPIDSHRWTTFCDPKSLDPNTLDTWDIIPIEDARNRGLTPCSQCFPNGYVEPNQTNSPLPNRVAVTCEELAQDAVEEWLGGAKSHEVTHSSLAGSSNLAGYSVMVEFAGYLKSPEPIVSEEGIALLSTIRDDNHVTVRVLPDREVWENE